MTKFVFITDTHLGASSSGYFEQQKYPERADDLVTHLADWINAEGDIDFVIHGGDMVETPSDDAIEGAVSLMARLPVPVYLCLGNHDLSSTWPAGAWPQKAPGFFGGQGISYTVETEDCRLHVLPTHYGQAPCFLPDQLELLDRAFVDQDVRPHVVITHWPLFDFSPEHHGTEGLVPSTPASAALLTRLEQRSTLPLVLCGHSHLNTRNRYRDTEVVTGSSFIETPFEFKVVRLNRSACSIKTVSLAQSLGFVGHYNDEKAYVQGEPRDRSFDFVVRG